MKAISLITTVFLLACSGAPSSKETSAQSTKPPNEEWLVLFDGSSLEHWHNYGTDTIGPNWVIEGNTLHLSLPKDKDKEAHRSYGGDILTNEKFGNFVLELEWKISECGNSGIMHHINESTEYGAMWETGPEMQILDNDCYEASVGSKHRSGDLYDLASCSEETVNPVGQWNQVKIKTQEGHSEYWLNGKLVIEFDMWNDEWNERIAHSKFKDMPGFGQSKVGQIGLQDHGNEVWFRNIRIKRI